MNTNYINRFLPVKNEQDVYLRFPIAPDKITIEVYNCKTKSGSGIKIIEKEALPLLRDLHKFDFMQKNNVLQFVRFAEDFCDKAGYLEHGTYHDPKTGKFVITYQKRITKRDDESKVLNTPARVNGATKIIDLSSDYFRKYTTAGRMAIILHEFSHVYLNNDSSNEFEADLNAARIYLALGYPRVELLNAWLNVFYNSDTPQNRKRWEELKTFIDNYDASYNADGEIKLSTKEEIMKFAKYTLISAGIAVFLIGFSYFAFKKAKEYGYIE